MSFYDWMMEEGYRKDSPARQTRRAKRQPTHVYRLVREEAVAMLRAAMSVRERRAIYLGICAGLRNAELRGLRGEHFERPGWIWVSSDIAKGGRERWMPVTAELAEVVEEIRANVAVDEYVLPASLHGSAVQPAPRGPAAPAFIKPSAADTFWDTRSPLVLPTAAANLGMT